MSLDDLRMQQERRRRLTVLVQVCAVALALALLASWGPSDARVAGASGQTFEESR